MTRAHNCAPPLALAIFRVLLPLQLVLLNFEPWQLGELAPSVLVEQRDHPVAPALAPGGSLALLPTVAVLLQVAPATQPAFVRSLPAKPRVFCVAAPDATCAPLESPLPFVKVAPQCLRWQLAPREQRQWRLHC